MPTVSELLNALPREDEQDEASFESGSAAEMLQQPSQRPVPVGTIRRLGLLGELQAKLAVAYAIYWIRGWFQNAENRQKSLAETHLRAAVKLLDSMGYLRGALMKIGQTLANFEDFVPEQFVETLDKLHYDAPPMHFSLLREFVREELGADPEDVFESFETGAFAAASLGQVHRARLKTGEEVAVKIQYPGIARTIRADFRNLTPLLLPARLSKDWESVKAMVDDLRRALERETDYRQEAQNLQQARALFNEDDRIIVPRIYPEFCTSRVLTMEYVEGVHLKEFLADGPSQQLRNHFGEQLIRGWYRLLFAGRMNYVDWHPGNFLFRQDGSLGLIDFGFVHHFNDREWEFVRRADHIMQTDNPADLESFVRDYSDITGNTPAERKRLELCIAWSRLSWKPRFQEGPFDYGDGEEFRRLITSFGELVRKRHTCGQSCTTILSRQDFACRCLLYRLGANIDLHPIRDQEVLATGWQRD